MNHNQTADAARPPGTTVIEQFPVRPHDDDHDDPAGGDEYLVDVETRLTILVRRAESPEDAIVKAVTGNPEGSDLDLDVVAHDVHVCIHTGIDDCEEHEEE
jgi:hypothetical protein